MCSEVSSTFLTPIARSLQSWERRVRPSLVWRTGTPHASLRIFVSSVMSLLFNTLSRFIITFLPRSNYFLISWLQSLPTVILEPKKRKSVTTSTLSPSICHEVMGLEVMDLHFF